MRIEDLKLDDEGRITRFCYKPEYFIKFREYHFETSSYEIRVHHIYPDASKFKNQNDIDEWNNKLVRYSNDVQPVVTRLLLSYESFNSMNEESFWNFLFEQIRIMEMHELKEWFKIDGKYFKNPHPETEGSTRFISKNDCFNV